MDRRLGLILPSAVSSIAVLGQPCRRGTSGCGLSAQRPRRVAIVLVTFLRIQHHSLMSCSLQNQNNDVIKLMRRVRFLQYVSGIPL